MVDNVRLCVCVSGPPPLLDCRAIRVRVVSLYIVPHLLSIHQVLQFPKWYQRIRVSSSHAHSRDPISALGSATGFRVAAPGGSSFPLGGGSSPAADPPAIPDRCAGHRGRPRAAFGLPLNGGPRRLALSAFGAPTLVVAAGPSSS
jgi:hypothetical protein